MEQTSGHVADTGDLDEIGLEWKQMPALADATDRAQEFLIEFGSGVIEGRPGVPILHSKDVEVLLRAARTAAALEVEVAVLRLAASHRERTGLLLVRARGELDFRRETLAEVKSLASQHLRGDPHGPQGAAAQMILDALAPSARVLEGLRG